MIFPIYRLAEQVGIDIAGGSMTIGDRDEEHLSGFSRYETHLDSTYLSPYLWATLEVFDRKGHKESLEDYFLLDLGNANALVLNRNREEVVRFIKKADRMMVKDTTRFKPNPAIELGILWPEKFTIADFTDTDNYIPAMKLGASHNFFAGVLGNRFFRNFIIVFDRDCVYLKPVEER